MELSPEKWAEVKTLLEAALDLAAADRGAFLEIRCPPDVRQEVERLLAEYEQAGSFLSTPAFKPAPNFVSTHTGGSDARGLGSAEPVNSRATEGTVIGRYRLMQRIGAGGMGEVWLAEQKEPVRRRVALKLIRAGMNSREVVARFESERQALALMDHPTIAKVFDAGSTPLGAPYFVMECVAGLPITDYCDNHRLSTRARLELFMRVCEGVQHAHQKAIIHRDLKPSNILVTEVDGQPAPKIIDFGVAKALGQKLTADTMFTRVGALVGTPEYMSPEQASSSGEDIDTRTDVYSLGIVLYELLAGEPPIDLRKVAFEEFLRRLREDEPPKPSTKIRTQAPATSTDLARKRQTEPVALARQMRGDLDSITLKALEKDRSRRYGSPSDFAADIGRYLRNEAVIAVPPSAAYQVRKFARRYRTALATIAAVLLVLLAAAAFSVRQSIRANREAAIAQAVNDFLQNDLLAQASAANQAGPSAKPNPHLEVRAVLDRAAARIQGKLQGQPAIEAAIRDTIGQTYMDIGLYSNAKDQLNQALQLQRRVLGTRDPTTIKTISRLGVIAFLEGKYPEAEALDNEALRIQRAVLGPNHPDTLKGMNNLSNVYWAEGRYSQADALLTETLDIERRVLGSDAPGTLASLNNLANVNFAQGKFLEAETLYSQTVEVRRRVLGPEHPNTLTAMGNLANTYMSEGKFAQAEALTRETLEIERKVLGPEHPNTLQCMDNLAVIQAERGEYNDSAALLGQISEISRRTLGPEHPDTLRHMENLASVYTEQAKYQDAEELFGRTIEVSDRVLGPEHPLTLAFLADFAEMFQREGQYRLAETHASRALMARRRVLGSENPDTIASAADLALAYIAEGKFAEAEPLSREVLEYDRNKQPDNWQRFRAESLLGASLAGQKKYPEAEPLLLEGYQGMAARKDRMAVPDQYHIGRARVWILQLYRSWGKPEKADQWRRTALAQDSTSRLPEK